MFRANLVKIRLDIWTLQPKVCKTVFLYILYENMYEIHTFLWNGLPGLFGQNKGLFSRLFYIISRAYILTKYTS